MAPATPIATQIETHPVDPASVAVVVLTAPRSKSYLTDTLVSLDRGGAQRVGFASCTVLHDGRDKLDLSLTSAAIDASWCWRHVPLAERPSGNLRAFLSVFEWFLAQPAGVPPLSHLLFFEDDIVVCENALAAMCRIGVPDDCAFTSFFDMKEAHPLLPEGLWRVSTMGQDGRGYWGSQALLWPRRTIEYIVSRKEKILSGANLHSSDCLFGAHLLYSPWVYYALCVPNLVEHIGDVSAIWSWVPKINRKSTSFRGQDFNADELFETEGEPQT